MIILNICCGILPIDEKGFMLKLEEYAEDKDHTKKVRWVANKFKNIRR